MNSVKSRITAFDFWAEWISTGILMVGIVLTAYNVYPLGIWFSMIGNFGWFVVATIWKKWSLIVIQLMAVLIYISGLFSHYGVL
jgi:uncharacterized membrane protein